MGIPEHAGRAKLLRVFGPFIGLALVIALFGVLDPEHFLSALNFRTVLTQTVIVAIGALGMTFVVISAGIDLSVGSSIALSTVVAALLLRAGYSPAVAALAAIASGAAVGFLNGLLVTSLKIVPFIVTLGTLGVVRGVAKYMASNNTVSSPPSWLASVMAKQPEHAWMLFAPGVWLMIVLAALMAAVLKYTVLGTWAFAVGSNEATARLCGVPVPRVKVAVYTLSGLMTGIAGLMQFSRLTQGDPTVAVGKELDIIAAVVIGGASLNGGAGSIMGSVIGAFVMSFLSNGCNLCEVPNYAQEILIGSIIIAAVALDRLRR